MVIGMFVGHSAMVRTAQPALEQRHHLMNVRQ